MEKNNHRKKSAGFDPDRLSLQKKDVLEFCDKVLESWQKSSTTANAKNIAAMLAVRTSVYFTDEDSLKAIWNEIIKWIYQLLYENAVAQAKEDESQWASTLEKLKK